MEGIVNKWKELLTIMEGIVNNYGRNCYNYERNYKQMEGIVNKWKELLTIMDGIVNNFGRNCYN